MPSLRSSTPAPTGSRHPRPTANSCTAGEAKGGTASRRLALLQQMTLDPSLPNGY
jgi:hypothetical protein